MWPWDSTSLFLARAREQQNHRNDHKISLFFLKNKYFVSLQKKEECWICFRFENWCASIVSWHVWRLMSVSTLRLYRTLWNVLMCSDCVSDGNQCQSNMCVHGACVDQYQSYVCRCNHGYEGRYCDQRESDTDDCDRHLHCKQTVKEPEHIYLWIVNELIQFLPSSL